MYWNKGNSAFLAKKDELEILLSTHKPLCLGVAEANVDANSHLPGLCIDGYSIEMDSLFLSGKKGRVITYIKTEADYIRRKDLEPETSPLIWIEFNPKSPKSWLMLTCYREWRTLHETSKKESGSRKKQINRLRAWEESWCKAEEEGKPLVIVGDMNIDADPWLNPSIVPSSYQMSMKPILTIVMDMCSNLNIEILKSGPTRYQGKAKSSVLDLVLSNKMELLSNHTLINSSSDHKVVMVTFSGKPVISKP